MTEESTASHHPRLPKVATLALLLVTLLCVGYLWQVYLVDPWTRDGRLRAEVAEVAAQVSGNIVSLHVNDNGFVAKGGVILEVDPHNYQIALNLQTSTSLPLTLSHRADYPSDSLGGQIYVQKYHPVPIRPELA